LFIFAINAINLGKLLRKGGYIMAIYVCPKCGAEREARCKPKKCPSCGEVEYAKKEDGGCCCGG
jgi:rubrerythrin